MFKPNYIIGATKRFSITNILNYRCFHAFSIDVFLLCMKIIMLGPKCIQHFGCIVAMLLCFMAKKFNREVFHSSLIRKISFILASMNIGDTIQPVLKNYEWVSFVDDPSIPWINDKVMFHLANPWHPLHLHHCCHCLCYYLCFQCLFLWLFFFFFFKIIKWLMFQLIVNTIKNFFCPFDKHRSII